MRTILLLIALLGSTTFADSITSSAAGSLDGSVLSDSDATPSNPTIANVDWGQSPIGGVGTKATATQIDDGTGKVAGAVSIEGISASPGFGINSMAATNTIISDITAAGTYSYSILTSVIELGYIEYAFLDQDDFGAPTASYSLLVELVQGGSTSTIFASGGTLVGGRLGAVYTQTGTSLGAPSSFGGGVSNATGGVLLPSFAGTFALGALDAGDFVRYTYGVDSSFLGLEAGAFASIGDPNDLSGTGATAELILTGGADPVPEPGTIVLLLAGVAGLAWSRRRRGA